MSEQAAGEKYLLFPSRERACFALLGSGRLLCDFARLLVQRGFPPPVVVTHPRARHERDEALFAVPLYAGLYESVFQCARDWRLPLLEVDDVNAAPVLEWLDAQGVSAVISLGCRSIIRPHVLRRFEGRVLNCHSSDLPRYRGGGGFSWQILNGETDVHFTLHVIDTSIDAGDVLLQRSAPVGKAAPYPMDFMRTEIELAGGLCEELLKTVAMGTPLRRTAMEAWRGGTYFPRLLTEVHGVIDWSWPAVAIERTVRAFGWPYPGASTWVGEQRLALGRCSIADSTAGFHPFMAGLIVNCWPDGTLEVVAGDGSVLVHTLRDGADERPAASILRLGMRLSTPVEALVNSRAFRAKF